ncbi:MAG: glycoside hydrolase [Candidatus Promineofilum sp.]|nr:glycoside hydrolase [Promineifilum sp.]
MLIITLLIVLIACRQGPEAAPTQAPQATTETAETTVTTAPTAEPTATDEPAPTEEPPTLPTAAPTEEPAACSPNDPIYLAIVWHQHQPVYFQDPETGVFARPWVRLHAAKDYVDMAAILRDYPDVKATFNLTPSLLRQLEAIGAGATDLAWEHTLVPAEELTDAQKQFILDRFFDTNRRIVARFPRYQELLDLRDNSDDPLSAYSADDFRDLQLLFNLAWTDPDWLAEEPLAALVEKGEGFSEEDKVIVLDEHLRLVNEVIPLHRELQDAGQIEITTTPFAHPILPLLVNSDLALNALPDATLPSPAFTWGQDAVAQVELGVAFYTERFGQAPRGMWPSEGSVAEEMIGMVATSGIQWMASDEGVLAQSLNIDSFTRDGNEVVIEADRLYRPYNVQGRNSGPVAMLFRDRIISDKVGFTYSGLPGEAAADDFMRRIHAICGRLQSSGAEGPHLVSVILDGENAWENYDNDGKAFLHALYQRLSDEPSIVTVTPSEFLATAPEPERLGRLWAGSWHNADFSIWIGEEDENRAWDLLRETRVYLQTYITGRNRDTVTPEELDAAFTQMYIAEGSDWFWYIGSDQTSADDASFDSQFRNALKQVYVELGAEPPSVLDVPIIPVAPATADRLSGGLLSPLVDGVAAAGEWDAAGAYVATGGVMATTPAFAELAYGFDARNLYLKTMLDPDFTLPAAATVEYYFGSPATGAVTNFSRSGGLLGFAANRMLELRFSGGVLGAVTFYQATAEDVPDHWSVVASGTATNGQAAFDVADAASGDVAAGGVAAGEVIEMAVPLAALGDPDVGARLVVRGVYGETIEGNRVDVDFVPSLGPAELAVPDLGTMAALLDVTDPTGDDTGPGTYTYPTDAVFQPGNFDITNFQVGADDENILFRFTMAGPVDNPWDGTNGLSLQTFDIYIDQDGDGAGGVAFLPGRNLSLAEGSAWDYAITVEGWESKIFTPGDEGPTEIAGPGDFAVITDPGQQKVTVRVPKSILGDTPEAWRYAAVVMSQEGFPSGGVLRVRDVGVAAEQWRIGGAPAGATNHTRVLDLVWPEAGQQEAWLSDFAPSTAAQAELTADDFARVEMLTPGP